MANKYLYLPGSLCQLTENQDEELIQVPADMVLDALKDEMTSDISTKIIKRALIEGMFTEDEIIDITITAMKSREYDLEPLEKQILKMAISILKDLKRWNR